MLYVSEITGFVMLSTYLTGLTLFDSCTWKILLLYPVFLLWLISLKGCTVSQCFICPTSVKSILEVLVSYPTCVLDSSAFKVPAVL